MSILRQQAQTDLHPEKNTLVPTVWLRGGGGGGAQNLPGSCCKVRNLSFAALKPGSLSRSCALYWPSYRVSYVIMPSVVTASVCTGMHIELIPRPECETHRHVRSRLLVSTHSRIQIAERRKELESLCLDVFRLSSLLRWWW
jgi:hypothetical protein